MNFACWPIFSTFFFCFSSLFLLKQPLLNAELKISTCLSKVDNSSFIKAIWTILLADFTMSLDNVLGVAGAAGDHYSLLIFGIFLLEKIKSLFNK